MSDFRHNPNSDQNNEGSKEDAAKPEFDPARGGNAKSRALGMAFASGLKVLSMGILLGIGKDIGENVAEEFLKK